jgi:hypothetical protein
MTEPQTDVRQARYRAQSGWRDQYGHAREALMWVRDAATLRAYVKLLGLSERALAARAGVGHATLNHLLSGRRTRCSHRTARAIEAALGCPSGVFFDAAPPADRTDPDAATLGTPGPRGTPDDGVLESGVAHA